MLTVVSVAEAIKMLRERFAGLVPAAEELPLDMCAGRICASDIVCEEDIPPFSRSVMDGYAVRSADTAGAGESIPSVLTVKGEVFMGEGTTLSLAPGECVRIPTGGVMPFLADAVVPVEYTDEEQDCCLIYKSVGLYENVNRQGDDVPAGRTVIRKGTELDYTRIAVLAAMGKSRVRVYKRPSVGIISTGDELIPIDETVPAGCIRDVNSHLLSAMCSSYGCTPVLYGIVRDDKAEFEKVLRRAAAECDAVLVSGGSSAGVRDMTAEMIASNGEVLIHGLAMKPGKPTIAGAVDGKPVFGLPGHPAACCFVTRTVVKEILSLLSGVQIYETVKSAVLAENISSNHGREEYLCVRLEGDKAYPVYGKSGVISQLSSSDGYIVIPRDTEGLPAGTQVGVHEFL